MNSDLLKEEINGAKNWKSIFTVIVLLIGGFGFFLAGLSSYFNVNFLKLTDTSQIAFIPQGITLLFYGTCALSLAVILIFYIFSDFGSGYNEFSKIDNTVRIVRKGLPGKNRIIFLSYEFKTIKNLKFLIKQGLNPRCNILLVLKDKREIPLFPPQFLLNPSEMEKKAISLSTFLNVPIETQKV